MPKFEFKNLTRTDLLQYDGKVFVNVPVYSIRDKVRWEKEEIEQANLRINNSIKTVSLVGHKHTTNDILGLKELINDLGVNSGTNIDLSKYLLTSSFRDHLNNLNSAKHVTQAHLDKLNSLDNYWQLDAQGNLYTTYNTYSTQGLSAFGLGEDGGGTGGGGVDMLDDWTKYTAVKANYYVPASLLVPFRSNILSRLDSLESGGGGGDGSVTSVGLSVPTGLSVTGSPITSSGTLAISFTSGYSIPTTTKQGQWDTSYSQRHTHGNKTVIDTLTQGHINVLNKLSLDAQGNVKVDATLWATGGVSALGLGEGGGEGGGTEYILPTASATTLGGIKVGNGLTISSGILSVIGGGGGGGDVEISITGSGNAVTGVSKSGNTLTFAKSSTFALSTHNHTIANITGLEDALNGKEPSFAKNNAFNKDFGTTAGTVAQGNDSRINNGQTSFGWGNHASAGYALNSALTAHTGNSTIHITATERTNWNDANSKKHTHANKALLDLISQSNIDVLNLLSVVDGNIKVDTTLWATGGISALGLGGGGFNMLDSWANYTSEKADYYVPASLGMELYNDKADKSNFQVVTELPLTPDEDTFYFVEK